jgi:hypothetical protein
VAVQLALKDQEEAEPFFHLLKQEEDAIEGEIGVELSWLPKPDKKVCVVQHEWKADPMDRDEWPEQHSRMRELLGAFHRAFSTRLRELDASEWSPQASERARIEES